MKISVRGLNHTYSSSNSRITEALGDINIDIQDGEFVSLIGPSGCGKSTLLRILAGLINPTNGKAIIGGQPVSKSLSAKQIGWLAQNPALLPWRTVLSNVRLAQQINPQNGRTKMTPNELLSLVDLEDFADAYPFTLSGGMQQRVALARTLALGAKVWLMDEPFASLDELTREILTWEVLKLWMQFRPTVVWVTHHIFEAVRLSDRVLVMTPRPGSINTEMIVPLTHPRIETNAEFQHISNQLRASLGFLHQNSTNLHQS
ncbi:MAG: ABC transporter ATP-binding protein [Anaerolineales bacterium]|jgi:NitT/TauT family transport system ATP-binding protein